MLSFRMQEPSQNPYAAPLECNDVDSHSTVSTRMPADTYFYVGVVFCISAFGGIFIGSFFAWLLPPIASIVVFIFGSLATGFIGARRMYLRLADIHQRKVAWEIQQSEWANGIG